MNRSRKRWAKLLILSFVVVLPILLFDNLAQGGPYDDTVYFEPAPGTRLSADGDTIYVNPGGDIKINMNLKNETYIAAFNALLLDECYDGNIFLDSAKNNGSPTPKCFEGTRVPQDWGAQVINLALYPPQFLVGGVAVTADPLPPGDGPLAILTFTVLESGNICVDTFYTPIGVGIQLVDIYAVGYTPVFFPGNFIIATCPYTPGDLNWDEIVDLLDLPLLVYYLFRGWEAPCPLKAADVNCDQGVGLVDVVYLINYIFRSGPAPQICDY